MTKKPHLTIKKASFNGKQIFIKREVIRIIEEGIEPSRYFEVPVYYPLTQRPLFLVKSEKLIKRLVDMFIEPDSWSYSELQTIRKELILRN